MPDGAPVETDFAPRGLDVLDPACPARGRRMDVRDHRDRHLPTLDGAIVPCAARDGAFPPDLGRIAGQAGFAAR